MTKENCRRDISKIWTVIDKGGNINTKVKIRKVEITKMTVIGIQVDCR